MTALASPDALDRVVDRLQELGPAFTRPTPDTLAAALPALEEAAAVVSSLQRQWAETPPDAESWPAWRERLEQVMARLVPLGLLARRGVAGCQASIDRLTGASYTPDGVPAPEQQLAAATRRWRGDL